MQQKTNETKGNKFTKIGQERKKGQIQYNNKYNINFYNNKQIEITLFAFPPMTILIYCKANIHVKLNFAPSDLF